MKEALLTRKTISYNDPKLNVPEYQYGEKL